MTGKQRIEAALSGESADRIPVLLHHFMFAAAEDGVTMRQFRDDPAVAARALARNVEKYDLDAVFVDVDTALLAGACGVPVDFPEDEPARCHGRLLADLADAENLGAFDVAKNPRILAAAEIVRLLKQHFGGVICIRGNADQCPFSLASMLRGKEDWMMDLMDPDAEALAFRLLDHCLEATCQFVSLLVAAGADVISNGDSPAGPDMISPALYRKFALPYERKVAAHAHALGRRYILHICGNTTAILDDVATTGADGFEIDYKTDVVAAREALRGRMTFVGNIDPSGVLARGTPELVARRTAALLDVFAGEPRFILNSGCALPSSTPAENIRAFLAAARKNAT
jgi:uroporphyrinogen decarboxylase